MGVYYAIIITMIRNPQPPILIFKAPALRVPGWVPLGLFEVLFGDRFRLKVLAEGLEPRAGFGA